MKVRIGGDGIIVKEVNGKSYTVNCSQSHAAGRLKCGVDCSHCNEGLEQSVNRQTGQVMATRRVIILSCSLSPTSIPLEEPVIQTVQPGIIIPPIREN